MSAQAIIEADGLDVFYGSSQILFGLDIAVAQGETMAERYQGGLASPHSGSVCAWWHLLSEDAVSEAGAAASSGAKRSRSV